MPRKTPEARTDYEKNCRPNKEARREYVKLYNREYRKTEKFKQWQRDYRAKHRRLQKGSKEVLVDNAITENIWLAQDRQCAICKRQLELRGRTESQQDHDHDTLELRGVLCPNCNTGLGQFKDDPLLLEAAAAYLRRYGK